MTLGIEKVINGTFVDSSGWTMDAPENVAISENKAVMTTDANLYQSIASLEAVKIYRVSFSITGFSVTGGLVEGVFDSTAIPITGDGDYSSDIAYTATAGQVFFTIEDAAAGGTISVSNVSVREVLSDTGRIQIIPLYAKGFDPDEEARKRKRQADDGYFNAIYGRKK
jgi:hypothetical protein